VQANGFVPLKYVSLHKLVSLGTGTVDTHSPVILQFNTWNLKYGIYSSSLFMQK